VKPELVEGERTVVSGVPVLPVDSYRCWYATAIADNATLCKVVDEWSMASLV
jgi:hypothetical protein